MYFKTLFVAEVRSSTGNKYHMTPEGVLTFRIVEFSHLFIRSPS
jgi:hypothetical protein